MSEWVWVCVFVCVCECVWVSACVSVWDFLLFVLVLICLNFLWHTWGKSCITYTCDKGSKWHVLDCFFSLQCYTSEACQTKYTGITSIQLYTVVPAFRRCWLKFQITLVMEWLKDKKLKKIVSSRVQTREWKESRHALTKQLGRQAWGLGGYFATKATNLTIVVVVVVTGNIRPQSSQLAEPLWTDPGIKNGISVCKLMSTANKYINK